MRRLGQLRWTPLKSEEEVPEDLEKDGADERCATSGGLRIHNVAGSGNVEDTVQILILLSLAETATKFLQSCSSEYQLPFITF